MLFKSALLTQASGSVGGMTASHNKGGMYLRGRGMVTNPNTGLQQTIRSIFGDLATAWNALTQAQRDAWSLYASNVTMTNKLGDSILLSGQQMFVRSNTARIQAGIAVENDGPTTFDLGETGQFSIGDVDEQQEEVEINFDNTQSWANEVGSSALVYFGRPVNAGISYFKGPYRYAGRIKGAAVAPASPQTLSSQPFQWVDGQKLHVRIVVVRADGRVSSDVRPAGVIAQT